MPNKIIVKDHKYYFKVRGLGGVKGDKGDTGPAGPQGPQGPYVDVVTGTTTTLPAGSSAQVTVNNMGNTSVLNFGIPQGTKGDKGDAGTPGAQGPRGFAATVNVGQTTTGAPGTNASVINAGNEHDAVLKFTIPQGAKGDTGETGPQGPTGGIKSTVVAELPETGQSDTYYLLNRSAEEHTATTTDGYTQITNTENTGDLTLDKLNGNTTQTKLTGKNLCPFGTKSFTTYYQEDGLSIPAGTYTFSASVTSSDTSSQYSRVYFYSGSAPQGMANLTRGSRASDTVTLASAVDRVTLYASVDYAASNGKTATYTNMQLESGSSMTEFEQYCGGVPAPNPAFPFHVNIVTGAQTVQVVGKNLLDQSAVEQGSFNYITGNLGNNNERIRTLPIKCLPSTEYTISANQSLGEWAVIYYDIDGVFIGGTGQDNITDTYKTWTSRADAKYMRIRLGSNTYPMTAGEDYNIMLSEDSTQQNYEPYARHSYEINLGKNLFDKTDITSGYRLGSDGAPFAEAGFFLSNYIVAIPNQAYAYSRGGSGSNSSAICFYDDKKTFISRIMPIINSSATSGIITSPTGTAYIRFCDTSANLDTAQIETGVKATTYSGYKTPIELAKIGTSQDYIWNDNGTWKVHKAIHKIVLDGYTETTWSIRNTGTDRYYYRLQYLSDLHYLPDGSEWISDRLSDGAIGENTTEQGCFIVQNGELRIRYGTEMSLSDWKDYLKDHNITLYYQAETPTDTEITDSELIEQLDALAPASMFEGVNNVMLIPSAGAQGELALSYVLYDKYNQHQVYIWSSDDNTWQIILP